MSIMTITNITKNKIINAFTAFFMVVAICFLSLGGAFLTALGAEDDLYRDSITAKPAPTIKEIVTEDESYAAVILDEAKDNELVNQVENHSIYITAFGERDNSPHSISQEKKDKIKAGLERAHMDLINMRKSNELNEIIDNVLEARELNKETASVSITDLFDITLSDGYYEKLVKNDEFFLQVTLRMQYSQKDDLPIIVHLSEKTGKWEEAKAIEINEDGSLTVEFYHLCAIAVLYINTEPVDEDACVGGCSTCRCIANCPFCYVFCTRNGCYCILVLAIINIFAILVVATVIYALKR